MNDSNFFQTRMGQHFYDKTMPELVRQLERLNNVLELLVHDARVMNAAKIHSNGGTRED